MPRLLQVTTTGLKPNAVETLGIPCDEWKIATDVLLSSDPK
jgi:hypothetical protein